MSVQFKDGGGPAFPRPLAITPAGDTYYGLGGMTLRDWFAGQALVGIMTRGPLSPADAAWAAYAVADAMLEARK